uniref:Uncharacterized protein n=1 Tax=Ceratitis capitata TaxID=7213 RepID=W8BVS0_CERCA
MQRLGESYRHKTNVNDVFEDHTLKTCEELNMQTQNKPFASDNLNLQMKYARKLPHTDANRDNSNDVHHSYTPIFNERLKSRMLADNRSGKSELNELMSTIMDKNSIGYYSAGNGETDIHQRNITTSIMNNCKSTDTLTATSKGLTNGSKHWKNLSKRMSMHSKMLPDESDSNDTDALNSERHTGGVHYKTSPRTDSASKTSSRSFNEDPYNDTMSSAFSVLTKKSSTMLLDSSVASNKPQVKAVLTESRFRRMPSSNSTFPQESDINFIMLVGLLCSLSLSKLLQYIQWYCAWFMGQALRLRNMFLGQNVSIWEFCNFDDTSRYCLRTKLLLLPVVGCCSLLYALSSLLHSTLRCLLMQAPTSIIIFIQKLYMEP